MTRNAWRMQRNQDNQQRAVIIGGSLAGLLAARVLVDHFDQVTIIERDHFPATPTFRPGVPQGRHAHFLLVQGRLILERLFPGITSDLKDAGAIEIDVTRDLLVNIQTRFMPRVASGNLVTLTMTRELLEWTIRQHLNGYSRVEIVTGYEATNFISNSTNTRIVGVRTCPRPIPGEINGQDVTFHAELIVDASGRNSRTPRWLSELGYTPPKETTVNSFAAYATQWYELSSSFNRDWQALAIHHTRSGVVYGVEHNRWVVTLSGAGHDYPPTDQIGFLDFARSLPVPDLHNALQNARPISRIYGFRRNENSLRHYEHLHRWPDRLVVLGDAVCTFNPIYAQGMTTSVLAAVTLDKCLGSYFRRRGERELTGFAKYFQKRLAKTNTTPWLMATSEDFRHPATIGGKRNRMTQMFHTYLDQVQELAADRPSVYKTFAGVVQLVYSPLSLFQPGVLFPLLARIIRQRLTHALPARKSKKQGMINEV